MPRIRRNQISYDDERRIVGIGALAGAVAAFSGAAPTGTTAIDVAVTALFAGFVTWASASAAWWALIAASGLAFAAATTGPIVVTAAASAAILAAGWIGVTRANQPLLRAAVGGLVVNVAVRLEWNPFFLGSALVALIATGLLVGSGIFRRRRYIRKRVYWAAAGVGAFAAVAVAGIGIAALQARDDARDGYVGLLDGLEFVQDGKIPEAADALRTAADDLESAAGDAGGLLGQPARVVPGVAQNRNAGVDILERAADAAASAADALDVVDLDQLTVSGGVIDVFAFEALEAPLADLEATISELDEALVDAQSPWLVSPLASRLDDGIRRANQAAHQTRATAAAARIAPDMLGADGPRRYFLAFVNAAEARGLSGLMGNWSEITIDNGRIEVTRNGRTADLQEQSLRSLELDMPQEYIDRYAYFGARANKGVSVKYWSNVTMTPDMPSVGNAMQQMYENVTGRSVDGVFVIDAAGLAALLEITGAVTLDEIDQRIDSSNAEEFLTLGQYEFAENEREDLLTEVTDATIDNVLNETLPAPQRMAPILAPAVLHGHISGWAADPDEQELFELVGMDASLPVVNAPGVDAIAVSNNNASGNKIESFLERRIEYRVRVDEGSGEASALLRVEFTNNAPTTGYEDYVIGNLLDLPSGTNRMLVDVYTRLGVDEVRVDGEVIQPVRDPELGYWVTSQMIDVSAGETATLELDLSGDLDAGPYQLVYRPQPLPNPDDVSLEAVTAGGDTIFEFDGVLERRSVINTVGVNAWR